MAEEVTAQHFYRAGGQRDAFAKEAAGGPIEIGELGCSRPRGERGAQGLLIHSRQQARINPAPRQCIEDKPGLGLAAFPRPEPFHGVVIGVDLDREPVAGVQELDQPGEGRALRRGPAQQILPSVLHEIAQRTSGQRARGNHAPVVRMVAYFPGFAVRRLGG